LFGIREKVLTEVVFRESSLEVELEEEELEEEHQLLV